MRLQFVKGKQKELLKSEKEKLNLTWRGFANHLGMKFGRLKSFFYEEILLDEDTFNKLKLRDSYNKFILDKRPEGWGQSKGGFKSKGRLKEIKFPEKTKELAEFWGIVLGDGHIEKIKRYKVGVYKIRIAGHSIEDKDYLLNFVKPLGEKLFGIKSRIYKSKHKKCLYVILDGKNLVDFFEGRGFKAGNKIKNQVGIPNWIKENNVFLSACLRGLHDTDGTFYKLTNQESHQIGFTNHNFKLLNDSRKGLLNLGIKVSSIINKRKYVITKKSEIEKFYKLIGFHNPKHLNKIKLLF